MEKEFRLQVVINRRGIGRRGERREKRGRKKEGISMKAGIV